MGKAYKGGLGVVQDYYEAQYWFRKAEETREPGSLIPLTIAEVEAKIREIAQARGAAWGVAWERTFGGAQNDGASSAVALPDGGLVVVGPARSKGAGQDITGAARIIDGDTLEVAGERIRIYGIDAPESHP